MSEQRENLERVASVLAGPILAYCRDRVGDFRMDDLRAHLRSLGLPFSPDSPSRILRELRLNECLDYVVVNRAQSLYRIVRHEVA